MPYLGHTAHGEEMAKAASKPSPFGPGFGAGDLEQAGPDGKLECWHSGFNDPGPDYSEFKLFDGQGQLVASRYLPGY